MNQPDGCLLTASQDSVSCGGLEERMSITHGNGPAENQPGGEQLLGGGTFKLG